MKLLVSIINQTEAKLALKGGADIIDIKNPKEGSLGANFPRTIDSISKKYHNKLPISAAAGDMPHLPGTAALAAKGLAHCGVDFIKIGLLGSKNSKDAIYLLQKVKKAVREVNEKIKVVGVGYADYERADTLDIKNLVQIAINSEIDGIMLDTFIKDGTSIIELRSKKELEKFITTAKKEKLITALAGSLKKEDFAFLTKIPVDIIGVRSAACHGFNRQAKIKPELITELKQTLK